MKLVSQLPILTVDTTYSSSNSSSGRYQPPLMNSICLPDKDIVNTANELALSAGYGYIDEGVVNNGSLMMAGLMIDKLIDNRTDAMGNWILGYRHPFSNESPAVCKGDSGGPLIQYVGDRAVLIGINSRSSRIGPNNNCQTTDPYKPMFFMRVSKFIDWIVNIVTNN
ncbi:plasminogen-like [Oppia nitens]|uniref:plasminogen-like n=1 Tax=Oppia nitens TaxID=1686743 RepID=UPI0023DB34B7|nr:plasminogen-like [Oppia nitens]